MSWPDGEQYDSYEEYGEDGLYDTKDEAEDDAYETISCGMQDDEIINMSNIYEYSDGEWDSTKIKVEKVKI